jgi:hypothetical protein
MNGGKLKSLLQSKSLLLEDIEGLLRQEEGLLEAGKPKAISAKCNEVTSLTKKLENINSSIASFDTSLYHQLDGAEDQSLRLLSIKIARQMETNRLLMESLVDRALKSRDKIRRKLDDTVFASQISGYKPYTGNSPIYLDRRN